mmetsp:Transcript_10112/g.27902  ORF Transcript_10112/g.27902 Transcript_10112/m.27902 type:complete len:84 (+) Transcript_10112:103-354(+)
MPRWSMDSWIKPSASLAPFLACDSAFGSIASLFVVVVENSGETSNHKETEINLRVVQGSGLLQYTPPFRDSATRYVDMVPPAD